MYLEFGGLGSRARSSLLKRPHRRNPLRGMAQARSGTVPGLHRLQRFAVSDVATMGQREDVPAKGFLFVVGPAEELMSGRLGAYGLLNKWGAFLFPGICGPQKFKSYYFEQALGHLEITFLKYNGKSIF